MCVSWEDVTCHNKPLSISLNFLPLRPRLVFLMSPALLVPSSASLIFLLLQPFRSWTSFNPCSLSSDPSSFAMLQSTGEIGHRQQVSVRYGVRSVCVSRSVCCEVSVLCEVRVRAICDARLYFVVCRLRGWCEVSVR